MKTGRYEEGDEPDRKDVRHLMPTFPDDPASRFLEYYRDFGDSGQNESPGGWHRRCHCREVSWGK